MLFTYQLYLHILMDEGCSDVTSSNGFIAIRFFGARRNNFRGLSWPSNSDNRVIVGALVHPIQSKDQDQKNSKPINKDTWLLSVQLTRQKYQQKPSARKKTRINLTQSCKDCKQVSPRKFHRSHLIVMTPFWWGHTADQTWDLSKNLHDRIFRPTILHTKSA